MFKYRKNLRVRDNKVFSYGEHVANIIPSERKVVPFRWYSVTTSKHVNHVAKVLGYTVEKVEKGGANSMSNQLRIYIRGGCLINVESNFKCEYQLIDYDNVERIKDLDAMLDRYEPDAIYEDEDLFSKEVEKGGTK